MNKRTMVTVALAGQLLIPGFAIAVKSGGKNQNQEAYPPLPSARNTVYHPLTPYTAASVPVTTSTVAQQQLESAAQQQIDVNITQQAPVNSSANNNNQLISTAAPAPLTAQPAQATSVATTTAPAETVQAVQPVTTTAAESATPATSTTTVTPQTVTASPVQSAETSIIPVAKELSATPAATAQTVRFALNRSKYAPANAFVPEQARIGIGYDSVITEVVSLDVSKITDAKLLDGYRDRTGKALRDIYYYLDKEMRAKRYAEAKGLLEKIQQLALMAQAKGILSEDKKSNVVAWVKSYSEAIDSLEKERTQEINQLRIYKPIDTKDAQERAFDWQALAIALGLQDDAEQAVKDFEALDQTAADNNKSGFAQTANGLITYLTEQSNFAAVERTISATTQRKIIPGADQLTIAYNAAEAEKRKVKKEMRKLVGQALLQSAHLSALQNKIRTVAADNYSTQVVHALGEQDEIDYTKLSIASIYQLLQKPDSEESEQ